MKFYILLTLILILFSSCDQNSTEPIANPDEITTIKIQNNITDTLAVSIVDNYFYLLENNKVKYKTYPIHIDGDMLILPSGILLLFILIIVVLIVLIVFYTIVTEQS